MDAAICKFNHIWPWFCSGLSPMQLPITWFSNLECELIDLHATVDAGDYAVSAMHRAIAIVRSLHSFNNAFWVNLWCFPTATIGSYSHCLLSALITCGRYGQVHLHLGGIASVCAETLGNQITLSLKCLMQLQYKVRHNLFPLHCPCNDVVCQNILSYTYEIIHFFS